MLLYQLERARTKGALAKRLRLTTAVPKIFKTVLKQKLEADLACDRYDGTDSRDAIVGASLVGLSDRARKRMIKRLLPSIADAVEAGWQAMAQRPYQQHCARLPYRCPRSEASLTELRGAWLMRICFDLGDYDRGIEWFATWAAHLMDWNNGKQLAWLLAGALDVGGKESDAVFEILKASAEGEHPIAQMGEHVPRAMMSSNREEAWAFNERLLLAAQRQEGLRQSILEAVDESHPSAFRRMARLILEENLTRFSSVVRAADSWFGFMWDAASGAKIQEVLEEAIALLEDPARRVLALEGNDPERAYLALWSYAFEDIESASDGLERLLAHAEAEMRFVATHFLVRCDWSTAAQILLPMLRDKDLRIAARALSIFGVDQSESVPTGQLVTELEALFERVEGKAVELECAVWPWMATKLEKSAIAGAMLANKKGLPTERIMPAIKHMSATDRACALRDLAGLNFHWKFERIGEAKELSGAVHETMVDFLGDASAEVRDTAFKALEKTGITELETERLIELLRRKSSSLRTSCLERLCLLKPKPLLAAAERLLADKNRMKRLAGLDLLRAALEDGREEKAARAIAAAFEHEGLHEEERAALEPLLGGKNEAPTFDDALGLLSQASLMEWPVPKNRKVEYEGKVVERCIDAFAEKILEHQNVEVRDQIGNSWLLINSIYGFPEPGSKDRDLPVESVWRALASEQQGAAVGDELVLVRALIYCDLSQGPWKGPFAQELRKIDASNLTSVPIKRLILWAIYWTRPKGAFSFVLDGLEASLVGWTSSDFRELIEMKKSHRLRKLASATMKVDAAESWLAAARMLKAFFPSDVTAEDSRRMYSLLRWFQLNSEGSGSLLLEWSDFAAAHSAGVFGEAVEIEFTDLLIGRHSDKAHSIYRMKVWGHKLLPELSEISNASEIIKRCRDRIVDIETKRGDPVTVATRMALDLPWSGGLETLSRAMSALGKTKFARTTGWGGTGRKETLSHLVMRSAPREEDSPEAFANWVRESKVKDARLVELACYAPLWARHVDQVLEWPGLESAVWWVHVHTKDDRWHLHDLEELWAARASERTSLSSNDLHAGAVDVEWFNSFYEKLGKERWSQVHAAAKFSSSSGGHKRAQLFAQSMIGDVSESDLLERIDGKRHKDAVCAFGLLPLPAGSKRSEALLARYERLVEFKRESRQFGSMRQESEGRAVAIAMDNLARTAGFKDPQRLQWAMELRAVRDLKDGPVEVLKGEVSVALRIDDDGKPGIDIVKSGKALKSMPAKLRKDADILQLRARATELRRQASRVKESLESAMCRGDVFEGAELQVLMGHPILRPALERLVFLAEDIAGYPVKGAKALENHEGKLEPVRKNEELRIAHPQDLLHRGDWSAWQRDCFRRERVQPFKQIFRELYPLTETERSAKVSTHRFAGHQVNPSQAISLLRRRGWTLQPEEGVSKSYHQADLTARLGFQQAFYTPAEIEGLTLEIVEFTQRGKWKPVPLEEVPERIFSETMRDLDLVVSVAHQGGVDPEANASTMQMRGALLRETCTLLGLDNVEVLENHAVIEGELAGYSVHLGSALAHIKGGPALVIVAVGSQHRGRLFLPFADDDPRTAEVLSKVLLLARDKKIKDPSVLQQIRSATKANPQ